MDGVRLAVLTNRMQGIVRAMAKTIFRTGRSCVFNTSRDFSNCIVTHDHQLLAAAESLPIQASCSVATTGRAPEVYGVVVDAAGEIDEAATAKRRCALAEAA